MKDYSILLMGAFYNNHMIRFVKHLKKENPNARIDFFAPIEPGRTVNDDYMSCFRECRQVTFSSSFHSIPLLRALEVSYNWHRKFHQFSNKRKYDIVNIHYPLYHHNYILNDLQLITDNLVLTPWGSDVYRIDEHKRRLLKNVFDTARFVTGAGDRFTRDFMNKFDIPKKKFIHADIGSEMIDYITENKEAQSTEDAKRELGIEGRYVITCGYNSSKAQRHIDIINAISKVRDQLPHDLVLLFPVTYPKENAQYVSELKKLTKEKGINSVFFEDYLDVNNLFVVRQATDMFIHVQTTDANNTSIKEYLLLNKNCINGAWMVYDDIETDSYKPYYTVSNIDELDKVIIEAYIQGTPVIKESVTQYIQSLGCKPVAREWNSFFESISSKR